MTRRMVMGFAGIFSALSLGAAEAVWNQMETYSEAFCWMTCANWLVAGAVPAQPPTNATDSVSFAHNTKRRRQTVYTGTDSSPAHMLSFGVGKITGDTSYEISNGGPWTSGASSARRTIAVADPNDFTGFFAAPDSSQIYRFTASDAFTPEVHNVDAAGRTTLELAGTGTVEVEALYNPGAAVKAGPAKMHLGGTYGGSHLYVTEGDVDFAGHAPTDTVEQVMAAAYLHLDASVSATFDFAQGSATSVTNWRDVRQNGMSAWVPNEWRGMSAPYVGTPHAPFVSARAPATLRRWRMDDPFGHGA